MCKYTMYGYNYHIIGCHIDGDSKNFLTPISLVLLLLTLSSLKKQGSLQPADIVAKGQISTKSE